MVKYLKIFTIGALLLLASLIGYLFVDSNWKPKRITLLAPHGKVIIVRDEYNVPHIRALSDDNDAYYALGYMHAQDRLWQMEFQRRVAAGKLSEIFGEATLKKDEYLRTWGFYKAAQKAWEALDPQTKQLVHAYTQGVNAFLAQDKLPLQFYFLRFKPAPWTDVDSVAWQKMMAWNLDTGWERKIKNYLVAQRVNVKAISTYYPAYPNNAPVIVAGNEWRQPKFIAHKPMLAKQPQHTSQTALNDNLEQLHQVRSSLGFNDAESKGSNAWVVSGKLTKSGKPLLANDVHLPLTEPSLWYQAELKGPTLHVIGATIPGLPLVAIGHNDDIAWGVTHSYVDTQDLYIESANAKLTTTKEIINIKGRAPEIFYVKHSQHGPIISTVSNAGKVDALVAIKWPALMAGDTTAASFAKINRAHNWVEFVNALKLYVSPPQNFLYADRKGNIGYYLSGKIPLRSGWTGDLPVMPNQHHEWQGYISFDQLPHVFNPAKGYIATANNRIVDNTYPYSLTFRWNVPPFRIQQIVDMLQSRPVDVESMQQMQMNVTSNVWLAMRDRLLKVKPTDDDSKTALTILTTWQGNVDVNSSAATIFAYWYQALLKPASKLADVSVPFDPAFLVQQLQRNVCYADFNVTVNCETYLSETLHQAMHALIRTHGRDETNWKWGEVHQVRFEESAIGQSKAIGWIWNRSAAAPGGDFTVNVGTYDPETFNQTIGVAYRQIIDLNDWNNSSYVIPLGEIDDPMNMHYNDQLSLWLKGKYVPMTFDANELS